MILYYIVASPSNINIRIPHVGIYHTQGRSRAGRTVRISRAIVLQECGHNRWGGKSYNDWLIHKSVDVNQYLVKISLSVTASY